MKKLAYLIIIISILFAFGKNKKPGHSKYLTKHYVEVPAGKVYLHPNRIKPEKRDSVKLFTEALPPSRFFDHGFDSCEQFYIAKGEVSNLDYREFLNYLKQQGRLDEYERNMLDTSVWSDEFANLDPFVNYYYQHQAYNDYPVVGVSLEQASAYANWLTEIYQLKNQGVKITFSIPTKKQWIRAARGENTEEYPWNGSFLRNSKGAYLSNFKTFRNGDIHFNENSQKYELINSANSDESRMIMTPTLSYYPNQFGVYCMSGNVAELISDDNVAMGGSWNDTGYDVRVESEQSAVKPNSKIGFRVIATIDE